MPGWESSSPAGGACTASPISSSRIRTASKTGGRAAAAVSSIFWWSRDDRELVTLQAAATRPSSHAEMSAPAQGRSAKSSVVAMYYFDEDEFGGRDEHEQLDSPADEHICGDSCFDW